MAVLLVGCIDAHRLVEPLGEVGAAPKRSPFTGAYSFELT
jgi:hypothetical protein